MPVPGPHTLDQLRSGALAGIRRLDLSAGLAEFPREIFELADTLEVLNLSGNAFTTLPHDLPRLKKLRVLFCSDSPFTELPEVLGDCEALDTIGFKASRIARVPAAALNPRLRWLILTDNQVQELPAAIGDCTQLKKLMLAGNQLAALPDRMAGCTGIELFRLAANRFTALPGWLPELPRVSWLAAGGNPFSEPLEFAALAQHPLQDIDWSELSLDLKLGEGASGLIYRASWRGAPAAVKLFKGGMTSDGLPRSEMTACIAAGAHANLIPVLGRIVGHPQGTPGLVLRLIDPSFRNLGGPPSLDSCTRDVYAPELRFPLPVLLSMARGLASAAAHLHARGQLHGDFYAHNTLWNGQGEALLGDFGGSWFFDPHSAEAGWLQRIEMRAFGCLLDELVQRCDEAPLVLQQLVTDCLQPQVRQRPLMDEVLRRLQAIEA